MRSLGQRRLLVVGLRSASPEGLSSRRRWSAHGWQLRAVHLRRSAPEGAPNRPSFERLRHRRCCSRRRCLLALRHRLLLHLLEEPVDLVSIALHRVVAVLLGVAEVLVGVLVTGRERLSVLLAG